MVGGSSATGSNPVSADGLPLIMCTECGMRRVVRRTSQQTWSLGQIFYCCPRHKRDGSGCPFWFWKDEYISFLASTGRYVASAGANNGVESMHVAESSMDGTDSRMKGEIGFSGIVSVKSESELIAICKEVVRLLKALCFLCVCMLFLMFVSVCAHLFK
ncbi:unnamed protein product [Urochloa decumbens]|uniref:GRF-type domain-containing protein n=1 Tax=Urochloa decumbens TaxID=240449 RepID=A0ABC8YYH5_9POAL